MLKIFTVCPQGLGSSMIAKIHIRKILDNLGIDNDVETAGLASIIGSNYDLIVTVEELREELGDIDSDKVIFVNNFFKKDQIEEKLKTKLREQGLLEKGE